MYADGSVYDNVDIENTSKELDHGLLHLSVSSYEEGYLTVNLRNAYPKIAY